MAEFEKYQEQMYATSKSSHGKSVPGSLEQANALEGMCDALYGLIGDLRGQVTALTARVAELENAAREAGAGENTIDWEALEDDQRERDDPAKAWTPEEEAAYQAEAPPTLPHQP